MSRTAYDVTLALNTTCVVGQVWPDSQGLWHCYSVALRAEYGSFGTRRDAELEVVSAWERVVWLTWHPRGRWRDGALTP